MQLVDDTAVFSDAGLRVQEVPDQVQDVVSLLVPGAVPRADVHQLWRGVVHLHPVCCPGHCAPRPVKVVSLLLVIHGTLTVTVTSCLMLMYN